MKKSKKKINRRKFIAAAGTTAASFSIVPSHVLGGKDHVPPSDKIHVAQIGCGTEGIYELPGLLDNENIQVTHLVDVNKYTTDYLDWSPLRVINTIRNSIENPDWGKYIKGIPGGRDIGEEYVNKYYAKHRSSPNYKAVKMYEDYREMLEKETDIDAIKIMTPDHTHATIALAGMKKGLHIMTHKPLSNRLREGMMVVNAAKKYDVKTHLLAWEDKPDYGLILNWIKEGVIGNLKEIHNWSYRPVWPQYPAGAKEGVPIPDGFNWQLWLGPEKDRAYSPDYTHNVFRGWYDFGGGSIADMGHYSIFPLFKEFGITQAPKSAKAYGSGAGRRRVNGVSSPIINNAAFPDACTIKFQFPHQNDNIPAFDFYWYDGGLRPFAPEELEVDGLDVPKEGLMFVGDSGKILGGFEGEKPRIIPKQKMNDYKGEKSKQQPTRGLRSIEWVEAIKSGSESPGSFIYAGTVTEMINLGAAALRSKKRLEYDSSSMTITNHTDANKYLVRDYRTGWELA